MPSTPTYSFPYPALSDAPNVPAGLKALAEAVEAVLPTLGKKPIVYTGTAAGWTGNVAVQQNILSVAIPDPGWAYKLTCWASIGLLVGPSVKVEVSFRDNTAAGPLIGPITTWDRAGADTLSTYYYKTVIGSTGSLTGGRTVHLTGGKTGPGGNGTDLLGSAYSAAIVTVNPV
ncbi:hypothetical protein [Amycolatopsis sp. 195334CR]|uniref:hypothetical protein n=1 Tax=Amycolatopsis sp. 195334CR TaxID=2814588 RepID=UPI001A90858E|nr:hypothetical protein [Amycolatopsis sp. 195334CR]MBN6037484.1 hypothetical protein [Amycolatopsis sp. 195334CR]